MRRFSNPQSALRFLALPALVLLFFNKMAFSNLILARGDTFLYFYPYWQAASNALRNGRIPLWNPNLFMGAPLLANSQVGFFYPLNWPVWLLFSVPVAVKASILLHVLIAGVGAYLAGRRALGLEKGAAMVTAVLFALSGYLTAQVEHVNQLQGLAWLPWYLPLLASLRGESARNWRVFLRAALSFAALFSLQLLAGHTQTAFISGVAILIWLVVERLEFRDWRVVINKSLVFSLLFLFLGVGLALLVTAVQLLPTLELAGLSSRQGGLPVNEVLSFSLNPLLMGRALLPGLGQSLFSEYVAFFPLTALLLAAAAGAGKWRQRRGVMPAIALVVIGVLLALGVFNPLNWLLARLPGFDLFRVPARWLVLYALGISLLAGLGWDYANRKPSSANHSPFTIHYSLFIIPLALIAWALLAQFFTGLVPTGPEAPYEEPNWQTVLLWVGELGVLALWLGPRLEIRDWRLPGFPSLIPNLLLLGVATAVLFISSRTLPYNNLTTPEAYFDLRPPISRLLANGQWSMVNSQLPTITNQQSATGDRFLSISNIFFDPGDQGEIAAIYGDQLDAAALYEYTVAIKQKEIIAPNLPLAYGLAAVDGFDGGILPLRAYSELVTLLLPEGVGTTDGRLRENITAVPEPRWLDLFNARYLITDKTGDQWRNGLFFDLQHPVTLAAGQAVAVGYVPDFAATAVYVLADAIPQVTVKTTAGTFTPVAEIIDGGEPILFRVGWGEKTVPQAITLFAGDQAVQISGLALVNEAPEGEGSFFTLVPGNYRLIHSGDVKIYENLDVQPRAFLVGQWQWQPDGASSVAAMDMADYDPRQTAVLLGSGPPTGSSPVGTAPGTARIVSYEPEQVVVRTESEAAALLVLIDANYPGWETAVDGQPAELHTVNGLFRGVFVPAGQHEVTFTFRPDSLAVGRILSLVGLLFCTGLLIILARW